MQAWVSCFSFVGSAWSYWQQKGKDSCIELNSPGSLAKPDALKYDHLCAHLKVHLKSKWGKALRQCWKEILPGQPYPSRTQSMSLFLKKIFLMWTIFFKSLLSLLQHCFCFLYFGFFGHEACGILAPWPGIEPTPPALEVWNLNHWVAREVPSVTFDSTLI